MPIQYSNKPEDTNLYDGPTDDELKRIEKVQIQILDLYLNQKK